MAPIALAFALLLGSPAVRRPSTAEFAGHHRALASADAAGPSGAPLGETSAKGDAKPSNGGVIYSEKLATEMSREQFFDVFLTSLVGLMIVITFWELLVGPTALGQIVPTAAFSLFLGMFFGCAHRCPRPTCVPLSACGGVLCERRGAMTGPPLPLLPLPFRSS
jgi:hypothetical protein